MIFKVCGNNSIPAIEQLQALEIYYLGFIFYKKSPRYVADLNFEFEHTKNRVGIFVNASEAEILDAVIMANLDLVQLHGDESPEFCSTLARSVKICKAFQVNDEFDFEQCNNYIDSCSFFIFDSASRSYGGSGTKFNWKKLSAYKGQLPFLLSGGIGKEDVQDLLNFSHPALIGYDLNSKFEVNPGTKDVQLIKTFIEEMNSKNKLNV